MPRWLPNMYNKRVWKLEQITELINEKHHSERRQGTIERARGNRMVWMCSPWRLCRPCSPVTRQHQRAIIPFRRQASLTSAIERGRRRSNAATDQVYDKKTRDQSAIDTKAGQPSAASSFRARPIRPEGSSLITAHGTRHGSTKKSPSQGPISVPYTTPASQFLYGTFAVRAALKARKRKFYKLYLLHGEGSQVDRSIDIEKLARSTRVQIQHVGSEWARVLNKMAEGRPHNGYVLEASPLPRIPIRALEEVKSAPAPIQLRLDNMSGEERIISGGSSIVPRAVHAERYPFVLLLDRVLDPGNLGGIIRSAYFLGIDAVVLSRSGSAPISAVTIKASAGAAETVPILTANAPLDFVKRSRESGWQIFAAVSPSSESGRLRKDHFVSARDALQNGPCILVIGGEGEGIARSIMREISGYVGIAQVFRDDGLDLVESLNVSVATALMIQQFMEQPTPGSRPGQEREQEEVRGNDKMF